MVTYGELFALLMLILSIAALFYQIGKDNGKRK